MKILAIIPAKLDSKRLSKKNIRHLNGKPMLLHSVDYVKQSRYDVDIVVSSESDIVKDLCDKNNIKFYERPISLCGETEVVDVYVHLTQQLDKKYDIVVGLQPDNPNRSNTFDSCVDYMIENKYDDIRTINKDSKRSGAMRLFKYEHLINGKVSYRIGCIKEEAMDIHTKEDLDKLKKIMESK